MDYLKTIALKITVTSILSEAKMFSTDSSFWRYKIYVDIRGVLKFRSTYACVQIYAVLMKDRLTRTMSALCHLRIVP